MKITQSFLALAIAGCLFTSCKETGTEVTTATATNTDALAVGKMETASFTIEGMSCEVMCASKIQKELANAAGVQKATIDFEKKTATVEYDAATTSPEKLVTLVEAVNGGESYKVSNLKSTADQAMLFSGDQEKEKKTRKSRKQKKAEAEAAKSCAPATGKPGCCSAKKSCSTDKKATL